MLKWRLLVERGVCFNSFIAPLDHRINGEGTSSGDQGTLHLAPTGALRLSPELVRHDD
jgi:hypothetical protein